VKLAPGPQTSPRIGISSEEVYRLLQESGLRTMPFIEGGKPVGMLTLDDIGQASLLGQPTRS
jgi:predicted transcriptional regulator